MGVEGGGGAGPGDSGSEEGEENEGDEGCDAGEAGGDEVQERSFGEAEGVFDLSGGGDGDEIVGDGDDGEEQKKEEGEGDDGLPAHLALSAFCGKANGCDQEGGEDKPDEI